MGDAAQGELPKHEIFKKPFEIKPKFELWDTPKNYRRYPGGEELPDKIQVWRVQDMSGRTGGVVNSASYYADRPFAEGLVSGFNTSKGYDAIAVGRCNNLVHWGFWGAPSQMTDDGKKLLINVICYISKYDPKTMDGKK